MSPRKVDRMTRVNELVKRELAGLIEADRMWAGNILVSVTEVNTGTDLRNATVGISIFGGTASEKQKIMAELDSRKPKWQELHAAPRRQCPVHRRRPATSCGIGDTYRTSSVRPG